MISKSSVVRLRPLAAGDDHDLVRWRASPAVADQLFSQTPPTLAQHREWFERYAARTDRCEWVIEVGEDKVPVGTVGLSNIDRASLRAEYGILIGEERARGKGIALQATHAILDLAFQELKLRRIYLHVLQDNQAAVRLYERAGFLHEGLLREHFVRRGIPQNVVVMGKLLDDA